MNTELSFPSNSTIDSNLESNRSNDDSDTWISYIESLPGVVSADWFYDHLTLSGYTVVNFESLEAKTMFILRYS